MILLNWLPELFLISLLFVSLLLVNFKISSHKSLPALVSGSSLLVLMYWLFRNDLNSFSTPLKIIDSDSISNFGRIISLCTLIVFSLGFHFHRGINLHAKQTTTLFLVFNSIFLNIIFLSNNLILFLGASIGVYFCSTSLILLESNREQGWVRLFRQAAFPLAIWLVLISLLFLMGTHYFGSIFLSDWIVGFSNFSSETNLVLFAFLILTIGFLPLGGFRFAGEAPVGLSIAYFGLFLVLVNFWFRLGVPFFTNTNLLMKPQAQMLLSIVLGFFVLRFGWKAMRTRDHFRWYSLVIPQVMGNALFLILLPGEQMLPAFYCISFSMLLTFALVSHAFLEKEYRNKLTLVISMIALMGAPPLILGEQIYRLIHNVVVSGNITAGILLLSSWFLLSLSIVQMMAKILLSKPSSDLRRGVYKSELFFIGSYLFCVISLTALKPHVVALLNDHPILNLW